MTALVLTRGAVCASTDTPPGYRVSRHNSSYRVGETGIMTSQELVTAALAPGAKTLLRELMTCPIDHLEPADLAVMMAGRFLGEYLNLNTRGAYQSDLAAWFDYCAELGIGVLAADRQAVRAYALEMAGESLDPEAPPAKSKATRKRRLTTLSKFYEHCEAEDVITRNPVQGVKRPRVSHDSQQLGLSQGEAVRLLTEARDHGLRSFALLTLLLHDGIRVSEALTATVGDMTEQASQPVLKITAKGDVKRTVVLNAPTRHVLNRYLATRPPYESSDPLFATSGKKAWARSEAFRTVRMLAKRAGLPNADRVGPHTMRHTFVTLSLASGADLSDVQDAAGHRDPATTQRYNHARHQITRHPAHKLAAVLALDDPPEGET